MNSSEEVRIGELLNDYLDRRARGESINEDRLAAEHPDVARELAQHLSLLNALTPSSSIIQELVVKKLLAPPTSADWCAELGHYRITGVIGLGGMGIVLRAIDPSLGRPVALKVLRAELAVDRRALVRFEHEAKAAAALRHPNIVTVFACGEYQGTHYIAMELIDGESVADVLAKQGALATDEIRRIFRELLEGLAAAHAAGLIHRDIKSSNILLDGSERRVKIADFGLARIAASQTRVTVPHSAIGTPEYMSPEQARGDENVDHRTDLYSAGVVLYEMLTGRVPFKADTAAAVIHAILTTEPTRPSSLRKGADELLSTVALRLMSKRSEERFASCTEVLSVLHERRIRRYRSRRSRRRAWGAASSALVLIGLSWLVSAMLPRSRLAQVRVGKDDKGPTTRVEARWGLNTTFEEFYTFPIAAEHVGDARIVDRGPGFEPLVFASTRSPLDEKSLFAFEPGWRTDAKRKCVWSHNMSKPYQWPDAEVTDYWVPVIRSGDFDGKPGEEVVFVSTDRGQYPTSLGLLEPRSMTIRAQYWHIGKLANEMIVAPNFLGPGRPAIIVIGLNNKLDGFDEWQEGDPDPVADFDWVPIIMVLDLSAMQAERLINIPNAPVRMPPMPPVLPYAYAFLNAAHEENSFHVDKTTRETRSPKKDDADGEIMNFASLSVVSCPGRTPTGQCVQVSIVRRPKPEGGGVFLLDSDLTVLGFDAHLTEHAFRNVDPWLDRFHQLVVRGEYLGSSRPMRPDKH